ncbi:3D domain-containing protein [Bacillus sp. 7894-2]|uniref:3D domain-containing protein n=1 Tax=Bacillus sp. 7894-2 TaxID=2021695 RepID=UPI000BA51358|nr:3D domain-containing protein [Bacillus sp. 7894-2]PAE24046.1 hypothetical protein CHI10_14675 [Bacillus sp. 7894-2]
MYTFLTLAEDQSKVKIEATRETPYEQRIEREQAERRAAEIARTKARQAQQAKSNRAVRGKGAKASGSNANDNSNRVANVSNDSDSPSNHRTITVEATAYTADCEGCSGITKSGVDVRSTITHEGKRVIATDPSVIPLGSTVTLRFKNGSTMKATAQDIGAAINGHEIDILVGSKSEAVQFGRQPVEVVINEN